MNWNAHALGDFPAPDAPRQSSVLTGRSVAVKTIIWAARADRE
jgi:hypothetical protein